MKKETDNLLARYFGGNASEQDMQTLEQWISLSAENQLYFDQLTTLYAKLGGFEISMPKLNTEQAKKTFMAYIARNKQASAPIALRRKPFYRLWQFQAASIVLLLTISISVWFVNFSETNIVLATTTTIKEEVLPDQTRVKLSKGSQIIYSSAYGKKYRKIHLEGEATFKVGHQGNGTLQIFADKLLIEDIGTVFSVSAYADSSNIVVKVIEGQVHIASGSNGIKLKANETCNYNKQTKAFKTTASISDATSVMPDTTAAISNPNPVYTRHFQFNAMPLRDAVNIISKEYGVNIHFGNPAIGLRKITVDFEEEHLDMVLQVIAETLNLKVAKAADGYMLIN